MLLAISVDFTTSENTSISAVATDPLTVIDKHWLLLMDVVEEEVLTEVDVTS